MKGGYREVLDLLGSYQENLARKRTPPKQETKPAKSYAAVALYKFSENKRTK